MVLIKILVSSKLGEKSLRISLVFLSIHGAQQKIWGRAKLNSKLWWKI